MKEQKKSLPIGRGGERTLSWKTFHIDNAALSRVSEWERTLKDTLFTRVIRASSSQDFPLPLVPSDYISSLPACCYRPAMSRVNSLQCGRSRLKKLLFICLRLPSALWSVCFFALCQLVFERCLISARFWSGAISLCASLMAIKKRREKVSSRWNVRANNDVKERGTTSEEKDQEFSTFSSCALSLSLKNVCWNFKILLLLPLASISCNTKLVRVKQKQWKEEEENSQECARISSNMKWNINKNSKEKVEDDEDSWAQVVRFSQLVQCELKSRELLSLSLSTQDRKNCMNFFLLEFFITLEWNEERKKICSKSSQRRVECFILCSTNFNQHHRRRVKLRTSNKEIVFFSRRNEMKLSLFHSCLTLVDSARLGGFIFNFSSYRGPRAPTTAAECSHGMFSRGKEKEEKTKHKIY